MTNTQREYIEDLCEEIGVDFDEDWEDLGNSAISKVIGELVEIKLGISCKR